LASLEWNSGAACLYFHDKKWSEYRVLSPSGTPSFPEEIRAQISRGEAKPAPQEECIEKSIAFKAVKESLEIGERPNWLEYRHVG
jgi:hypothetical protein